MSMNLEKTTLWTMEIKAHAEHTWKGIFTQEPTFRIVQRAILMEIDELEQALEDKTNDESDRDWLYTQKERTQNVLELWMCLQDKPAITPAWKQVKVAGTHIGSYCTTTSEVFTKEPSDA